jgi:excisionase family DNA binding protein
MSRIIDATLADFRNIVKQELQTALGRPVQREWLSLAEVAEEMGVTKKTAAAYIRRDGLPAHRAGRSIRIRRSDLEAWLLSRAERSGGHAERHGATLRKLREG